MKTEGLGEELAKRVGAAIARHRKAAGYTQARVADSLGLENETVSHIENGGSRQRCFASRNSPTFLGVPSALFLANTAAKRSRTRSRWPRSSLTCLRTRDAGRSVSSRSSRPSRASGKTADGSSTSCVAASLLSNATH